MDYVRSYKFRLYPNAEQRRMLARTFGAVRYVYNLFLAYRNNLHEMQKKSVSYFTMTDLLKFIKDNEPERAWLKQVETKALRSALQNLELAFKNFFDKRAKYPRFKSRHHHRQSYSTDGVIRIVGDKIQLPKLGLVKFVQSRELMKGRIVKAFITHTASDKYFVSLAVKGVIDDELRRNAGGTIGLDVGIKTFCVDSRGQATEHPKPLKKLLKKLQTTQRHMSRKKPGSRNREKQRIKLARLHERIANIRLDFLHKLTTRLCRENQTIAVESLNRLGMMKNHRLARALADASWGEFFRQLSYKSLVYGNTILKVPTFYPSSQTCSECGYKNPLVKNLRVREWTCPQCGAHHDRDINAAKNILAKALEMRG